jgi:hypothetical protein
LSRSPRGFDRRQRRVYPVPPFSAHDTEVATKADLEQLEQRLDKKLELKLEQFRDDILRHFDLTVETIRHDLEGANRDQIQVLLDGKKKLEDRVHRLERHLGLVSVE